MSLPKLPFISLASSQNSFLPKDAAPSGLPKLPVEILEIIFTIASTGLSVQDRGILPALALVSRSASTWVLPILYATVYASKRSLPRLINKPKGLWAFFGPRQSQSLCLQYPTTSLVLTGLPPDKLAPTVFSNRFPHLRRISFEPSRVMNFSHKTTAFWQILAEVHGLEVVSFRAPFSASTWEVPEKPFGGFGIPQFQKTTHLALNWVTIRQFSPFTLKQLEQLFPALCLLYVQEVNRTADWSSSVLRPFLALPSLTKVGVTVAEDQDRIPNDDYLRARMNVVEYGEKVIISRVPSMQLWDTTCTEYPYEGDYFEALDDVWKEMEGSEP